MATAHPSKGGTRHRVVLRLLDHQIVGPDDQLLGNVDDLQVLLSDNGWFITGLAVGPAALGRRFPGKLGNWTTAVWRRLQTNADPGPAIVPMSEVTEIGSAHRVSQTAADSLVASFGLERWLRRYVISRIPGAKGGGDDEPPNSVSTTSSGSLPGRTPTQHGGAVFISGLINARVHDEDGAFLGAVNELVCVEPSADGVRDQLQVTHLEYGSHKAGSGLGYNEDSHQGPLLVGAVIRWWQRDSRVAPIDDVTAIDLSAGRITVTAHDDHVHPHRL